MRENVSQLTKQRSKELRREMTPAEKCLWYRINSNQLHGLKIRRQHSIGKYIADFYIHKIKLVIELDGSTHNFRGEKDFERDEWLKHEGYDVIHIPSKDVMTKMPDVLEMLYEYVDLKLKSMK